MKQRITMEQFRELTEERTESLKFILASMDKEGKVSPMLEDWLLSIGQMIEILDRQCKSHNLYMENNPGTCTWEVNRVYTKNGIPHAPTIEKTELCDCLWELVKRIL
jgi:hypothetical protein